jgi:hypothetical protein
MSNGGSLVIPMLKNWMPGSSSNSRDNLLLVYGKYIPFLVNFTITFTTTL